MKSNKQDSLKVRDLGSNFSLRHELTPPELATINLQLTVVFQSIDEQIVEELIDLLEKRSETVNLILESLNGSAKTNFAELELPIHNHLMSLAEELLATTKEQLNKLSRGKRALRQYL